MHLDRFIKSCSNIDVVGSERIDFEIKSNKIYISGQGDIGDFKCEWEINNEQVVKKKKKKFIIKKKGGKTITHESVEKKEYIKSEFTENFNIAFSLKYIQKILKISSICDRVKIHLSNQAPIKLKFEMYDNSYLDFYLAPKCD